MNFSESFLKELQELKASGYNCEDICASIQSALSTNETASADGDDDNGSGSGGTGPHVVG
jgi:hypothetical protein